MNSRFNSPGCIFMLAQQFICDLASTDEHEFASPGEKFNTSTGNSMPQDIVFLSLVIFDKIKII
ncbi:MAG: hypothetical protein ACE5HS_17685, partial [bacterium]